MPETIDQFVEDVHKQRELLLKEAKKTRFDINTKVEEDHFRLSVNVAGERYDLGGLGSIGLIVGHEKSRKTAVTSAIIAAALGHHRILGFESDIKEQIQAFDTEQRPYSFTKVNRSIYRWARIPEGTNPDRYHAYRLRDFFPHERVEIIKGSLLEYPATQLLVIDGIADLTTDFNDLTKSNLLVEEVLKMAGNNVLTLLTLHYGKGGLMLGHLGSAFRRKLDFLIETKLSEEDRHESIVSCKLTRDTPPFPDFIIRQDKDGRIYRPQDEEGMWADVPNNIIIGEDKRGDEDDVPF